ncbi:MAG: class E sortase [Propionibacteriaceae bacterium]|nr:class E sortase [Propionibacteriaceae bacterium]
MVDTTGHTFDQLSGNVPESAVVVPIIRRVNNAELKKALRLAKKTTRAKTAQSTHRQEAKKSPDPAPLHPPVDTTVALPPQTPELNSLIPTTWVDSQPLSDNPVTPDKTVEKKTKKTKVSKNKADDKPRKYWGVPLVLITTFLLLCSGAGVFLASNAIAQARYPAVIASPHTMGTLEIPRFGSSYAIPILPDTSLASLRSGVGWYEGTGEAGNYGNFALAGHRLGWGQPFYRLGSLEAGDEIWVTIEDTRYTYTVIKGPTSVSSTDNDVLAGVPGDPERRPTKALITLTTAATWLPSPERVVVIGELVLPSP